MTLETIDYRHDRGLRYLKMVDDNILDEFCEDFVEHSVKKINAKTAF